MTKRLILIPTLMSVLLVGCQPDGATSVPASNQPVKVDRIAADVNEPIRQFPGRIAAAQTANVASKVSGQIQEIAVQAGDQIEAGQVLLTLDTTDYQLNLDQARANFTLAKVSFDRVSESRKKGIATQADFDSAKANYDQARVGLQQAENQLADTTVTSPIEGIVVRVSPNPFDFISAGHPLIVVQSTDNLEVKFQVPSDIVSSVRNRQDDIDVEVIFDALPNQTFEADSYEFTADSDRSTRSYDVVLTLLSPPQDDANLLPGMDATVLMDLSAINNEAKLTVPSHAIVYQQNNAFLWRTDGSTVQKVAVSIVALESDRAVVTGNIKAGEQIVVSGVNKLTDGQSVAVWSND